MAHLPKKHVAFQEDEEPDDPVIRLTMLDDADTELELARDASLDAQECDADHQRSYFRSLQERQSKAEESRHTFNGGLTSMTSYIERPQRHQ